MNNIINSKDYFGKSSKVFKQEELKRLIQIGFPEAKKYILTYFCKSYDNSSYYFFQPEAGGKYSIESKEDLKMIMNVLESAEAKIIKKWFEKEVEGNFKINSDPRASRFYKCEETDQDYINLSEGFLHKNIKSYKSYTAETKKNVDLILSHIKTVWCSNNNESYEYIVNWLSFALTGQKMNTAIFLKSGEGTGKSIIVNFFIEKVIGCALGLITSKSAQLLKFNTQILGKILLCLEELPTASKNEWHTFSDILKDLITGSKIDIEAKFKDAVQVLNLISLIIITNNDNTIKFGKDIRRYFMADISHDKVGNFEYFNNLTKACENNTVGEAFFMYLLEHKENNKNFDERKIPNTETRQLIKGKNSTPIINFIKTTFVKYKRTIKKQKLEELRLLYISNSSTDITRQQFKTTLQQDLPIIKINDNGKNAMTIDEIPYKMLYNWFVKNGFWNDKYDYFDGEELEEIEKAEENEKTEKVEESEDKKEILKLKQIIEEQQKKIEELEKKLKQESAVKPKVEEKIKIVVETDDEEEEEDNDFNEEFIIPLTPEEVKNRNKYINTYKLNNKFELNDNDLDELKNI